MTSLNDVAQCGDVWLATRNQSTHCFRLSVGRIGRLNTAASRQLRALRFNVMFPAHEITLLFVCLCLPVSLRGNEYTNNSRRIVRRVFFYAVRVVLKGSSGLVLFRTSYNVILSLKDSAWPDTTFIPCSECAILSNWKIFCMIFFTFVSNWGKRMKFASQSCLVPEHSTRLIRQGPLARNN
jgi:hypothetical protein